MKMYNATVEVDLQGAAAAEHVDAFMDGLMEYSPAVGTSPRGWLEARISVPAETILQAATTAVAVVEQATCGGAIAVEIMTEDEFAAREGFTAEPDIVSTSEAASILGVSATRVRQLVDERRLQEVPTAGRAKVLTRSSVTALAAQERRGGRPRKADA